MLPDEGKTKEQLINELAGLRQQITEFETLESRHKRAEEAARRERERAEEYLNIVEVMLSVVNADENIAMINNRGCGILGYKEGGLIGKNWFDLLIPERIRDEVRGVFRKLMAGEIEPVAYYENPLVTKDGEERQVAFHNTVIRDPNNQIVGVLTSGEDITEHKQVEEALRESEQKYRYLFEELNDAAFLADVETGRILDTNKEGEALLGRTREEIIGLHQSELHPPEMAKEYRQRFARHVEKGHAADYDGEALRKDCSIVPVNISAAPVTIGGKRLILGLFRDITQRKRGEEALRESETSYKELAESIADVFFAFDEELRYTYWNKASEELTGVSAEDALGKHLYDLFPDNEMTRMAEQMYLKALTTKQPQHFVNEYQLGGKDFVFEISAYPSKGGLSVFVKDITERKQAEKILLESEDKYRKLFELSSDALFLIEVETGRILDLNETALKMYGYSREEALQMKNTDFSAEPSQTRQATIEHKQQIPVRYHRKKDGTIFPTDISVTYFTWYGKEVCVAAIRDITERKQAEEALRETRDYLEKLLNYAHAPIIVWDPAFRVAQFNHAFEHLTGYTAEEVIGRELQMLFPEASRDESLTKIRQTSGGEYWESVEIPILCKGGETRLALWNSANIYEKGGKTLQATIAQGQDITERKRAEEREKELQEELNLSSRLASIGELAAGVAHELNNPLTGIIGFSERLLRKSTDEEISRDLERIHSEAQRVAKVVENLRTFARRREPKKEYLDINEILGRTLELRAYELRTGNIELVVELTPGLPKIFADFGQIQQVFLNIILNAEQVMTEANGGGRLTIKTQKGKGYIRVSFDDDGPGIPSEHFDKLFDPFFTTRGEQGGTGLGLSACHGIMAEHGGKIYAKSRLGKGATFFVELPVAPEEIDESEVAEEEPVRRG